MRYIEAFNQMEKALLAQAQESPVPACRKALEDPRERLAFYERAGEISAQYGCPAPRSKLMIEDGIREYLAGCDRRSAHEALKIAGEDFGFLTVEGDGVHYMGSR